MKRRAHHTKQLIFAHLSRLCPSFNAGMRLGLSSSTELVKVEKNQGVSIGRDTYDLSVIHRSFEHLMV